MSNIWCLRFRDVRSGHTFLNEHWYCLAYDADHISATQRVARPHTRPNVQTLSSSNRLSWQPDSKCFPSLPWRCQKHYRTIAYYCNKNRPIWRHLRNVENLLLVYLMLLPGHNPKVILTHRHGKNGGCQIDPEVFFAWKWEVLRSKFRTATGSDLRLFEHVRSW